MGGHRTAPHAPSDGRESARRVSDGLDQGWSVGDVEGDAVRSHHGSDNIDGEVRVQGPDRDQDHRQEVTGQGAMATIDPFSSATELLDALRARRVTSSELTDLYIRRI